MVQENLKILLLGKYFLVVPFNKIPLFSKDLITSKTFFISLIVRVFPGPLLDVKLLLSSFMPLIMWYFVAFSANFGANFPANNIPFLKILFLRETLLVV